MTNAMDYDPDILIGIPIPGSFRFAVAEANANYNPITGVFDTITFDTSLAGQTINLPFGSLSIEHPVKIDAPKTQFPTLNYDFVTVNWTHWSGANDVGTLGYGSDWSVMQIAFAESDDGFHPDYGAVTLGGLKITGGRARDGAGIHVQGFVNLGINQCEITNNICGRSDGKGNTSGGGIAAFPSSPQLSLDEYGPNIAIGSSNILGNSTSFNDSDDYPGIDLGGGFYMGNQSSLSIGGSNVSGNGGENGGGGIYFQGGQLREPPLVGNDPVISTFLRIAGSTLANNGASSVKSNGSGGAIFVNGPTGGMISDSTFFGNQAGANGGAINLGGAGSYTALFGQVNIVACTFEANQAAQLDGDGTIRYYGSGGALNIDSIVNQVFIVDSTFSANTTVMGNGGAVAIKSSKFEYEHQTMFLKDYNSRYLVVNPDQSGDPPGQFPFSGGTLTEIYNTTIASNSAGGSKDLNGDLQGAGGGGLALIPNDPGSGGGQVFVTSTIVATNTVPSIGFGPDLWATNVDSGGGVPFPGKGFDPVSGQYILGYNLVGVGDSGGLSLSTSVVPGTRAAPLDPKLSPLASNGGFTKTRAISYTSPAYEKGDNPLALTLDQRGQTRVRALKTDIGAFEATGFAIEFPTLTVYATSGPNATQYKNQRSMITFLDVYLDPLAAGQTLHVYHATYNATTQQYTPDIEVPINTPTFDSVYYTPWAKTVTHAKITFQQSQFTYQLAAESFSAYSLNDGRYVVTVSEPPSAPFVAVPNYGFWRLFGDVNGDATDATDDFIAFRLSLGGVEFSFDYDGDGAVAASDFIQFRLRFGGSI